MPGNASVKRNLIAALILAAAAFALYFNTLHNGFVWDDLAQVKTNIWIRNFKFIPEILARSAWGFTNETTSYYRPGMHLGYMLAYHLFGPAPWGFHLLNVIFSTGVSVMAFLLALEIFESAGISPSRVFGVSFLSALLFTANPIHTEAVAWIASLPELSYSFFYLISLYFFILWKKGKSREGIYLSCLFFVLSFLCKETALSLPLAIAAYEISSPNETRLPEGRQTIRRLKVLLPYFALALAYFVLRFRIIGGFAGPGNPVFHLTGFQWFLNAAVNFGAYLGQLLYPFDLNAYHVTPPVYSFFEWKSILSLAVLLAFAALAFLSFRKNPGVFFILMMVLIPLLPALYLPALPQLENTYAERYLYLPSMGFAFISARLLYAEKSKKIRLAVFACVLALIISFSVKTVLRNTVWKDETTLWTDTIKKSPDGWVPQNQFGLVLESKDKYTEAISHFRAAMILAPWPNWMNPALNLGSALMKLGKTGEAKILIKKVIRSAPYYSSAHNSLGAAFATEGNLASAETEFRAAVGLNPRSYMAHLNLGILYYKEHRFGQALKELGAALDINPYSGEAHRYAGLAYGAGGEVDKAISQLLTAVRRDPSEPENYIALGNAYLKKGLRDKAAESYRAALKLDPSNKETQENLKTLLRKK